MNCVNCGKSNQPVVEGVWKLVPQLCEACWQWEKDGKPMSTPERIISYQIRKIHARLEAIELGLYPTSKENESAH